MDERPKTCPRCGGALQTLRRFTRSGGTVSVLVCQVCRYRAFVAGNHAAPS
jgi:predicted urease superfamily metal-dependent hydrolase